MSGTTELGLEAVRDWIRRNATPFGKLPPEREFARELRVSRVTLRRALGVLENEGVIMRRVGDGTYAGVPPESAKFRLDLPGDQDVYLRELQALIEPRIVQLAVARATSLDRGRIAEARLAVAEATDGEDLARRLRALRRAITRSAHNPVLLRLYDSIVAWEARQTADLPRSPDALAQYRQNLDALVDALLAADPARAALVSDRLVAAEARRDAEPDDHAVLTSAPSSVELMMFRVGLVYLAERFGEAAFLSALVDDRIELVDVALPASIGRSAIHPGLGPRPPHACSSARAILAWLPEKYQDAVYRSAGSLIIAQRSPASLASNLSEVRRRGFSICDGEIEPGIFSLAIPVRLGVETPAFRSIGLVGMTDRLGRVDRDLIVAGLREAVGKAFEAADALSVRPLPVDCALPEMGDSEVS